MSQSFFEILELSVEASYIEIDEAHRRLKARYSSDPGRLKEIELAYQTLSNPTNRKRYLQELNAAGRGMTTGDHTIPSLSKASSKPTSSIERTPTGLTGTESPTIPHESPPRASGRAQTEFFDAGAQVEPQPRVERPEDRSRVRQRTEFFDPRETPQMETPRTGSFSDRGLPCERSVRQRTEFLDSVNRPPAQLGPSSDEGRRGSADPSARSRTEYLDPGRGISGAVMPHSGDAVAFSERGATEISDGVTLSRPDGGELGKPVPRGTTELLGDSGSSRGVVGSPAVSLKVQVSYRNRTSVYPLQPGDNLVGRPPRQGLAPAVPLDDPAQFISRHHAVIKVEGQTCAVIDQGSDNGTYLNRRRLQPREPYPLTAEDVIMIEGRELRILVS